MNSGKKLRRKPERDSLSIGALGLVEAYVPEYAMASMVADPELASERGGSNSPPLAVQVAVSSFPILPFKHRVARYLAEKFRLVPLVLGLGPLSMGCLASRLSFILLKHWAVHAWGPFMLFAAFQIPIGVALAFVGGSDQDGRVGQIARKLGDNPK